MTRTRDLWDAARIEARIAELRAMPAPSPHAPHYQAHHAELDHLTAVWMDTDAGVEWAAEFRRGLAAAESERHARMHGGGTAPPADVIAAASGAPDGYAADAWWEGVYDGPAVPLPDESEQL